LDLIDGILCQKGIFDQIESKYHEIENKICEGKNCTDVCSTLSLDEIFGLGCTGTISPNLDFSGFRRRLAASSEGTILVAEGGLSAYIPAKDSVTVSGDVDHNASSILNFAFAAMAAILLLAL